MMLREKTGTYFVNNNKGDEAEVFEFASKLNADIKIETSSKDGTEHTVSTFPIPKEYELEDGTRLIKDKSQFYDPVSDRTFTIKTYKTIETKDIV